MATPRRTLADGAGTDLRRELAGVAQEKRRRRPSGEPPPLPRSLKRTGRYWLAGACAIAVTWSVLFLVEGSGARMARIDIVPLRWITSLRNAWLTPPMEVVNFLGSDWTIRALRWAALLSLLVFKRFRHLFVFLGSVLVVGYITTVMSFYIARPRPLEVGILGPWEGFAHPSRPVALLSVTVLAIAYSIVVPGRPRTIAKWVCAGCIFALGFARLYLAVDWPGDVVVGAIIGVTVPLIAFRSFTPNEVFPVHYGRGRGAHLDIGGVRGEAIKRALEEQLGLTVVEMGYFGLGGSAGSTPLRLVVQAGEGEVTTLFGKIYAQTHLRSDRSYKLGRALLYGRLEDESSFSAVRRLVQYEDYMLRLMTSAGINAPQSYGFVEITPEREYLIVTSFFEGAVELVEAEIDDQIIDEGLEAVATMWHNGIAHRDIKPSNLLVQDGHLALIDVAFGEARPSPWRQAVDLANMMLVLALRSDAKHVYDRAVRVFTPDEIGESFAATHGVTMPSQLRKMLKADGRNLLEQFRTLAPRRDRISIQRWSIRRLALTLGAALMFLILTMIVIGNLQGAGLL